MSCAPMIKHPSKKMGIPGKNNDNTNDKHKNNPPQKQTQIT